MQSQLVGNGNEYCLKLMDSSLRRNLQLVIECSKFPGWNLKDNAAFCPSEMLLPESASDESHEANYYPVFRHGELTVMPGVDPHPRSQFGER